jgi:NADH-quinone oxidoreductase subunit G
MKEVDTDAQINITDRGYGSEIATFQEEGVHSLLSGNLMDVCPVGAITTRDYRFKSRPWDNPDVVDTICTFCEKGCNTSAWLKAKPEWAKGARLVRITPRYNPEVNDYWMCDIGRFDYHWIEGDDRLRRAQVRNPGATDLEPVEMPNALAKAAERVTASGGPASLRFLISAHASIEELFLIGRMGGAFGLPEDGVAISWRARVKPQPANTKFKIPAVDAPNLKGVTDLGFPARVTSDGNPDLTSFIQQVQAGAVKALYVFDPGPAGSMGDVSWVIEARRSGKLPLLIVQGVLMTDLARAADIVLPGACSLEKDGAFVNQQGRLQGASRALVAPGDAQEDWQIFVNFAMALGTTLDYGASAHVRADVARALSGNPTYEPLANLSFARPAGAKHWLQASNPSERWKWDVMFQDLPPVKFDPRPDPASIPSSVIRLQKVD